MRRDFEMRFAAEAPAMAPANDEEAVLADEAAARSHTPAAAGRAWGTSEANLRKQQTQQQPKGQQQQPTGQQQDDQQQPNGPGRPPMTEEEAAKLAVQAAARKAGLGRKRLAAQAGRLLDRQAALSAAMQAKQSAKATALPTRTTTGAGATGQQQQQQQQQQQPLGRPKRGVTASSGGADYKTMPAASRSGFAGRGPREPRIEVEAHVMPGASRPASELPDADRVPDSLLRPKPQPQQQPETAAATEQTAASEAAAPHHVRSDIERVLLLEQHATAAAAAALTEEAPREPAASKPAKAVRKPSARMSQAVYKLQLQQRIQADQAAQARSWAALDYACAALLLMVAPVAVFLAAAVMEDVFLRSTGAAPSVPSTSSSASWSELPVRWAELTAGLWRRTRRAAAAAMKALPVVAHGGGRDQLPMCSQEQEALAAITSHATGVADLTVRRRH